jgi:hypothetical protein
VGQSFFTLANPGAVTFPEISAANAVSTKTAAQLKTDLSLTSTDVGLGSVTNNAQTQAAIVPNTAPSAGQILIGNAGGTAYAKNTVSGSGATMTLGATGVLTISAIPESSLSITNVTTGNATTSAHGFAPAGTVGTTQFWRQDWTLATPVTGTTIGGTNAAGYSVVGNGTTWNGYPQQLTNASTATVSSSYAADTYLVGSSVVVAAGDIKLKGQYHCVFDMTKTGAGVAQPVITIRAGTAGTTSDTALYQFTFGVGTAVVDSGIFEVWLNIRTTGGTATTQGICKGVHNLATTGLFSNANVFMIVGSAGNSFNQGTATTIGVSFNGGSAFVGTNTLVEAQLEQP